MPVSGTLRLALAGGMLAIALPLCGAAVSQEKDSGLVAIRATPGLPNSVIEYIARNSELRPGVILANERPEDFVAAICGVGTDAFNKIFFDEVNSNKITRGAVPTPRTVSIPACAKWVQERHAEAEMRAGEKLDDVLLRRIGRTGSVPFQCAPNVNLPRCGKPLRDLAQQANPGVNVDALQAGQRIKLPFATYLTTFKVKASTHLTAKQVVEKIAELGRSELPHSPVIKVFVAPPVRLLAPVASEDVEDPACVSASTKAKNWPYDKELVSRVIKRTRDRADAVGDSLVPTTVTVIDTGLDESFPGGFLRRNTTDPNVTFGIGTFRADQFRPDPRHEPIELRMHGTEVAEIIAGGSGLRSAVPDLAKLFRINIVNVMEPGQEDPDKKIQFEIKPDGVIRGTEWATANAQIANVSIGSETTLLGLRNAVQLKPDFLLVAAAGNDSNELGDNLALYPANYGGTSTVVGTQVISVAAHDANLFRAKFSNISKDYIDLMAPGCDIPFREDMPGVHGTSFAAPIVTMTAALLRTFGITNPSDVKQRLRVSVDYDESLKDLVLWSGRLNIPKALSLYDDVLESPVGTLTFGRWQLVGSDVCDDKPIDLLKLRKVTRLNDPEKTRVLVHYVNLQGEVKTHECNPAGTGFQFTDLDGNQKTVAWSDFSDLVQRYRLGVD